MQKNKLKILIIRLSSLGDILHSAIILKPIKEKYPQAEITWLSESKHLTILRAIREVDKVIGLEKEISWPNFFTWLKELAGLIQTIRKENYDYVIDIQGLLKSSLLTYASRAKTTIGFSNTNAREFSHFFYQKKVATKSIKNIFLKNLKLLSILKIKPNNFLDALPTFKIKPSKKINDWLEKKLGSKKKIIIINPWSSFKNKNLPLRNLKLIIKKINLSQPIAPLLIYSKINELKELRQLKKDPGISFLIAPKLNLTELVYLINYSSLYIGVDSGPSYISFLLKKKTKILFGPTNAKRQAPPELKELNFLENIYSKYKCPIIHKEPITGAYRCINKNCFNNLCMKKFSPYEVLTKKNLF